MSQRYIAETPEQTIIGPIIKGEDDLDGIVTIFCEATLKLVQIKGWLVHIEIYYD